jgi:hypothetical protein
MKHKIGDKVRVRDDLELGERYSMSNHNFSDFVTSEMIMFKGKEVTILDDNFCGKYRIKEDNGKWRWTDEMFSGLAANFPKVVITTDGKTTTAKMYEGKKLLKTAESSCSPEDTFDFAVGAKLALERVTEKEQKFKIGQFVRVINNDTNNFLIGQIVQIIKFDENKVLCEGYCCDRRWIDVQSMFDYQIEELPEDGE